MSGFPAAYTFFILKVFCLGFVCIFLTESCGSGSEEQTEAIRALQLIQQAESLKEDKPRIQAVKRLREAKFETQTARSAQAACWQAFQAFIDAERETARAQHALALAEHSKSEPPPAIATWIKRSETSLRQAKKWFHRCEKLRYQLERKAPRRVSQLSF